MRLLGVASATLSLLLIASPALRAQDSPAKPEKETKKDDKKTDEKKDDKKDDKKKDEKGDEGDDDDDKPKKDEKLPFNPFAKAKKGDWSTCVGQMKVTVGGGGGGMNIPDQKMKMKFICKITKVTDEEVTVSMKQSGTMGMPGMEHHATFSLKENPSLTKYFSMDDNAGAAAAGPPIDEWKVEDDKKTVGGKEFTCKKYTGKLKEKAGGGGMGMDGKLTLWITDTTKGWGLIAMTMKGSQNAQGMNIDFNMDVELKGYGNGDTADFGKKPADDSADDEGDDDSDDAPKAKDKKDDDKKDEKKDDSKKDEKKDKKKDDKDD